MLLSSILPIERVDAGSSTPPVNQAEVLRRLAELLSQSGDIETDVVEALLLEREQVLSTGIGEGVAIPHTSLPGLSAQRAALLICPSGVDFGSCDGEPARIFFGVVGPKQAASEHLKILAKVSKILRRLETRSRLLESTSAEQALGLIVESEVEEAS